MRLDGFRPYIGPDAPIIRTVLAAAEVDLSLRPGCDRPTYCDALDAALCARCHCRSIAPATRAISGDAA